MGAEPGGMLTIHAKELLEALGRSADGQAGSGLFTSVYSEATGTGGNLIIETGQLTVRDGAQIGSGTFGAGAAGTLVVRARDLVELIGTSNDGQFASGLFTAAQLRSTGAAGNSIIETGRLIVRDGAQIGSGTEGAGSAGTLVINAKESVELVGNAPGLRFPSSFSTTSRSTGAGGTLTLETGRLTVRDGAQIQAATFGAGSAGTLVINAKESVELVGTRPDGRFPTALGTTVQRGATGAGGTLTLETGRLTVRDGAQIQASTSGTGSAGNLTINAKESVELVGTAADSQRPSSLTTQSRGAGAGGDLKIETRQLNVRNRATVNVSSESSGRAGQLTVQAGSIHLDNQGKLTAATLAGEGGNIALQVQDSLQMRRNSQISAEAGGTGNGGNITIDTDTLAALENSNITANAFEGRGGNIQIDTQGIFRSPDSDITATSQLGINGVVEITTADIDLQNSLTELATNFVTADQAIAGSCLARRNKEQGTFVITGNGGLPISPYSGIDEWESLTAPSAPSTEQGAQPSTSPSYEDVTARTLDAGENEEVATSSVPWKLGDPIVEAQAIVKTADGRTLVTTLPEKAVPFSADNLVCPSN